MRFSLKQINVIPQLPGVYKFYSPAGELLYVGKAKNLKKRVSSYFIDQIKDVKTVRLVGQIKQIEIIPVSSDFEAILLEAKLIRKMQPKYNVVWRDDKHFLYIKITREKFPKVLLIRKKEQAGIFFGPFPSATILREILSFIRTIFPYCTQKETAKRACFYSHLGLCQPCPSQISKLKGEKHKLLLREYRRNIRHIKQILEGKTGQVKQDLVRQMHILSGQLNYEKAAEYRDKLSQLDYLVNRYTPIASYLKNPKLLNKIRQDEQEQLARLLKSYYPHLSRLNHIECYDISNISGKLATGSMVTFKNALPDKNLYRRFRIKFRTTPNDFTMLSEVFTRRLNHSEWKLPDLCVIDGGKPQLVALQKVLSGLKIDIPLVGLAKREEEIVVPTAASYVKIKLSSDSSALNLVKRLRDEAHRFAHKYHSLLRLRHLLYPEV